jgi:integrase
LKLTKTAAETAAPKERRYRINDSLVPGLSLLVMPSGARTYYLRHRVDGLGLSAGHGLDVLGQLLGHTSIQSTRRYAHLIEDSVRAAVARIEQASGV